MEKPAAHIAAQVPERASGTVTPAAAVGAALDAQLAEERPREAADSALPPLQLIVEIEHRGNQTRPELERRAGHPRPPRSLARSALEEHFALGVRQHRRRAGQRIVQPPHPVIARDEIGQDRAGAP